MTTNFPVVVYVTKTANDPRTHSDINQLQDDVKAHADDYVTGWVRAGHTWTYASATTFTVAADHTARYRKGCKIQLTQTTAKYFYVVGSSYSAPNTTVTVAGGSDYTIASATITSPYYSYMDAPQGFPTWFAWSPTPCGFGATNPSGSTARFLAHGNQGHAQFYALTPGSSNATCLSMILPIVATCTVFFPAPYVYDNSASQAGGFGIVLGGGCTINFYKTGCALWTNTNNKNVGFALDWEF